MAEIANDLLPYLFAIIGFLIVYVLNGIKSEIKDVKTTVRSLEADMRDSLAGLDRRVSSIEGTCRVQHGHD